MKSEMIIDEIYKRKIKIVIRLNNSKFELNYPIILIILNTTGQDRITPTDMSNEVISINLYTAIINQ